MRHARCAGDLEPVAPCALDTCRLAGSRRRVEISDNLVEWDYGIYEGMTTPEIRAIAPGWRLFRDGCPGGESASDVGRRVDALLAGLTADAGSPLVVLFAHGHLLRVLGARWLGLAPSASAMFTLDAPSVSELGYERETTSSTVGTPEPPLGAAHSGPTDSWS